MSQVGTEGEVATVTEKETVSLQKLIDSGYVVKVTAVDFNGSEFDGSPLVVFGYPDGASAPQWLKDAVVHEDIEFDTRGNTDYAWFGIKGDNPDYAWAGPGDYIVAIPKDNKYKLVVVPGAFFDLVTKQ